MHTKEYSQKPKKPIMKNSVLLSLILSAALALVSCRDSGEDGSVPPAKHIDLDTRSVQKVAADNAFAFDFFRETLATAPADKKPNAFVSPLSLTMALGMVYNGTSPDAAAEMAAALGVADFTPEEINAHYQTLVRALLAADSRTNLAIANSIWAREGFDVKPTFYDLNREYYDAEVQGRNFDLPATVDEINKWCADNTNDRIPTILDGAIPADAVMYLINAVYFKGQWQFEFDKKMTRDFAFRLADGSTENVKMMSQEADLPYYWDETLQCVDLPYGNGAFSMMLVMPSDGNGSLDDLVAGLDADTYNRAVDGLQERGILLKMPRWKQECDFSLNDAIANLGMERIFQEGNLGGITDDPRLAVSDIKQKTFVEVNEEGAEAAAVTSVGFILTSVGPSRPTSFFADRPFLYLIRERSTGAILFMGRMDDPKED